MAKAKTNEQTEEIRTQAREGYDLTARLQRAPLRTKTVTVYTDAVVAEELGGAEDKTAPNGLNLGRRRWGIRGRLEEIAERADGLLRQVKAIGEDGEVSAEINAEIEALEAERAALTKRVSPLLKKLEKSALVVRLKWLPTVVAEDVSERETKKLLGIKGKISEERAGEYRRTYAAVLLTKSVESFTDKADDSTHEGMFFEEARAIVEGLPTGEFTKLDKAMYALFFESTIAQQATDNPDF